WRHEWSCFMQCRYVRIDGFFRPPVQAIRKSSRIPPAIDSVASETLPSIQFLSRFILIIFGDVIDFCKGGIWQIPFFIEFFSIFLQDAIRIHIVINDERFTNGLAHHFKFSDKTHRREENSYRDE